MSSPSETTVATNWEGRYAFRGSYGHFIAGREVESRGGESRDVTSPRDGGRISSIAWGGPEDVEAAVAAAKAALHGGWLQTSAHERSELLRALADRLEAEQDELCYLECVDNGKTIGAMTHMDINVGLNSVRYFAAAARTIETPSAQLPDASVIHHGLLEPIGVIGELLPWNGPIWTGLQRLAAITAAGNTAVMKPSEVAGGPVLVRVLELAKEVGFPDGVVNIVHGDGAVGEALVRNPDVGLVSLTGGTATGAKVLAAAAPSITRVALELGGKNPNLVFADGDLDQAVMWSGIGAFSNSGQICVAGSRVLVEESVVDQFVDGIRGYAEGLKMGDPLLSDSDIGPVVSERQADGVWKRIETAAAEGTIVTGGERLTGEHSHHTYVPPTVVVGLDPGSETATTEIFGPVLSVIPFRTEAEAVEIANSTSYGLSSGVFTKDVGRAWRVSRALAAGEVYINRWFTPGVLEAPSEGYGKSGLGEIGMRKYQQRKNLFFQVDDTV